MKYSWYFYIAVTVLLFIVAGNRFVHYRVQKDFLVKGNISCDPTTEKCFVANCNDGADCDTTTYKKVTAMAKNAPSCLYENNCENFTCAQLTGCEINNCSQDKLGAEEHCF
jgi:hypothetical protein